ncbi:MAG: hypothetical protein HND48_04695 [Chloroflexi bacterium]|nr:hypothetical protein [Chloroflexota bacterium]
MAWSSMDIFAELPSTGTLTSDGDLAPRANIYDRNGQIVAGARPCGDDVHRARKHDR